MEIHLSSLANSLAALCAGSESITEMTPEVAQYWEEFWPSQSGQISLRTPVFS